jgi:hypothetical protein
MAKPKKKKKPARSPKSKKATSTKLPKDAITLIVQLRPREGQETLLEAELRALVGPTRKEDGCLTYDLHRSTNTPHFLRWNARKDALLASRDVTYWKQVV